MKMQIAVLADKAGNAATFSGLYTVDLYAKEGSCWAAVRRKAEPVFSNDAPEKVREKIKALLEIVGPCRVIAGSSISGLGYSLFNRKGFSIFEIEAVTNEVLNGIAEDMIEERSHDTAPAPYPIETEIPGIYRLDLKALQTIYPEISSKKALKPFFENTPFMCLELICGHLPPWLEQEKGLQIQVRDEEGLVHARITKACVR